MPHAATARADEPLARVVEAICPGVAGLEVSFAEAVVGRIRANAEELGIPLSSAETCEPNVILTVVEDGREYLQRLSTSGSNVLAEIDQGARRALMEENEPARVLMRVRTQTRDGHLVGRRVNLVDVPQASMWSAHSRIYTPTVAEIYSSLVLIDREALPGLDSTQLADYVTFRAFSKARPQRLSPGESILTLFESRSNRPEELTTLDWAFLRKLYADRPNLPGTARLAALEAEIGRPVSRD